MENYWNAIRLAQANADGHRTVASNTETGWADDRMMQAYDLIWAVQRDNAAKGVKFEFDCLLRLVEAVDEILIDGEMA